MTTILVLARRQDEEQDSRFVTTLRPVEDWSDALAERLAGDLDQESPARTLEYVIRAQPQRTIQAVENAFPSWLSLFTECEWIEAAVSSLAPIGDFVDIRRGERRGWNEMFYPEEGHGIESAYLAPVLRSSAGIRNFLASPDAWAFCCSEPVAALQEHGHTGALRWIQRFERSRNRMGRSLPEVLARPGHLWYEMKAERRADFVLSINPEDRLFVARMTERSFVDQRLIQLTARGAESDGDLLHALLNTTLCMFLIEAAGFGRGLGVLDLSKDRVAAVLRIPDPAKLRERDRSRIVQEFSSLLRRRVLPIPEELRREDRRRLDEAVLGAVGLDRFRDAIRDSLLELYRIRKAATGSA